MKKLVLLVSCVILLWSCEDKPTLQKYFVKNTESPKFIALDLASNIIKTDKVELSETMYFVDDVSRAKKKVDIIIEATIKSTNRDFDFRGYFFVGPLSYK